MRIVHAANLQLDKDGAHLWNQDQKIHHGLVRQGHFVYPFSINDRARSLSPTGHKTFGKGRANKALVQTCRNVHPDLLLLGHAQYISAETLAEIRTLLPAIRIGLWYVDPLWDTAATAHLRERLPVLDAVFCTTGGPLLEALASPSCPAWFIPNAVDAGIECHRAFETPAGELRHDLLFFGRDKGEPERRRLLARLEHDLTGLRVAIHGCLGRPAVFGWDKEQAIVHSRMALNLSRRNDVPLYSSSRIAELMGNGILTLSPRGAGLEALYAEDEIGWFDGIEELLATVRRFAADDALRLAVARKGWQRNHRDYSGTCVAGFLVRRTLGEPVAADEPPWAKLSPQG